jgi:DNA-binding GntR family transcriptional regulator
LRFLTSSRTFHIAIAEATGNDRLAQSIGTLHDEMVRLLNLGLAFFGCEPNARRIDYESQHKQHDILIDCVGTGDPGSTKRAAWEHLEHAAISLCRRPFVTDCPSVSNISRSSQG